MKTLLVTCALGAFLAAATPQPSAAQHGAGLGIIVGEPTGLSAKAWVGSNTAIDAAAAWSFEGEDALHLHGDLLQHAFNVFDMQNGALPVYYGIGARLKVEEDQNRFGLRVPLGLAYIFPSTRADIFMEVAPLLDLSPETDVKINGAAGVRYFFQ